MTSLRRRELLLGLGGALALPLAARAQQQALPIIGVLHTGSPATNPFSSAEFEKGLAEFGYVAGKTVATDYRWAEGHYDRLPGLAADLVNQKAAVIVPIGLPAAAAAKAATARIPIVFWNGGDPVQEGLVSSLARPGGNLTGVAMFNNSLGAKRLELLRELLPRATTVGLLLNPNNPNSEGQSRDVTEAARALGLRLVIMSAAVPNEIAAAFANLASQRVDGLIIGSDLFLFGQRQQVIGLAADHAIPAIYTVREYASQGGLISYTSNAPMLAQMGRYTGRILNGEKSGELPVIQPTRFQMAINLKTAKTLGLTVPQALLARADEVIE